MQRVWFGSQAFASAREFNANIGAWNTVSVQDLSSVCADYGRRRALQRARSAGLPCCGTAVVRIADACVPTVTPMCASVFACAFRFARTRIRAANVQALSIGVDRVRFGSQVFSGAVAFNANIGAWNTASVTTLSGVCAAFGRRREPAAGALGRSPMRRGRGAPAAPPMRARACARTRTGPRLRGRPRMYV